MIEHTTPRFPAILIGGPPQAGKSVLAHSLKEALSEAGVDHYLLRAAPDGEGDWFQLAEREVAQDIRRKGQYTALCAGQMGRDIARRPLPFLVDVGGRPGPEDKAIFGQCTHAILLVTDENSLAEWLGLVEQFNLSLLAVLTSSLDEPARLTAEQPILRGVIGGLVRGQTVSGPIFQALVQRVRALFSYSPDELFAIHQQQAPTDLVVNLPRLHQRLKPQANYYWQPQDLPAVFNFLPRDDSLALYGRGPAWLYAAVRHYIQPHPFYQFDARRGWVQPVRLVKAATTPAPLEVLVKSSRPHLHLEINLLAKYLEYGPYLPLPLPSALPRQGVIVEGQLPMWLYSGLVASYRHAPWVAIYYPQHQQAIVVAAAEAAAYRVGQTFPL